MKGWGRKVSAEQGSGIPYAATLVSVPFCHKAGRSSVDDERNRGRAHAELQAPIPGEPGTDVRGIVVETEEESLPERSLGTQFH